MQRRHLENAVYFVCSILTSLVCLAFANSGSKLEIPRLTAQTFQVMTLAVKAETAQAAPKVESVATADLKLVTSEVTTCEASETASIEPSACQALLSKIEVSLNPATPEPGLCEDDIAPLVPVQWLAANI